VMPTSTHRRTPTLQQMRMESPGVHATGHPTGFQCRRGIGGWPVDRARRGTILHAPSLPNSAGGSRCRSPSWVGRRVRVGGGRIRRRCSPSRRRGGGGRRNPMRPAAALGGEHGGGFGGSREDSVNGVVEGRSREHNLKLIYITPFVPLYNHS
jgi:hypothetical protein